MTEEAGSGVCLEQGLRVDCAKKLYTIRHTNLCGQSLESRPVVSFADDQVTESWPCFISCGMAAITRFVPLVALTREAMRPTVSRPSPLETQLSTPSRPISRREHLSDRIRHYKNAFSGAIAAHPSTAPRV